MQTDKQVIEYEQAAEQRTQEITGWFCKTCNRFFGSDEHQARYCHAESFPCKCGKRYSKGWTCCNDCREVNDAARYFKFPEVEWDGETPLAHYSSGRFFFDVDELSEWLNENDFACDDVMLCICEPNNPCEFDLMEYLYDYLPDDKDLVELSGLNKINDIVNTWIKEQGTLSWYASNKRPSLASLKAVLER